MKKVYPLESKVIRLYLDGYIDWETFDQLQHITHLYESVVYKEENEMEDNVNDL